MLAPQPVSLQPIPLLQGSPQCWVRLCPGAAVPLWCPRAVFAAELSGEGISIAALGQRAGL